MNLIQVLNKLAERNVDYNDDVVTRPWLLDIVGLLGLLSSIDLLIVNNLTYNAWS